MKVEIGIIGGSGLYSMSGFEAQEEANIQTPFGAPSDNYILGTLAGRKVAFLARHGRAYLAGKNWSQAHWRWIREQRFDLPPLQRAFEATVFALEQALAVR